MHDDDVGVSGNRLELRSEELLSAAARGIERPVVEPGLPRRAPDSQAEQLNSRVLEIVTTQPVPVFPAPRSTDRGCRPPSRSRRPAPGSSQCLNSPARNACLAVEVALEGERHVAGNQQQIARGDINEILVEVRDADDGRHDRARIACIRVDTKADAGFEVFRTSPTRRGRERDLGDVGDLARREAVIAQDRAAANRCGRCCLPLSLPGGSRSEFVEAELLLRGRRGCSAPRTPERSAPPR